MIKIVIYIFIITFLASCSSSSDKIKTVILYNDSIGYWNYEWPRDRAEFYGFTFKLSKDGKLSKYSYSKVKNKRWLFSDEGIDQRLKWGIADDSIFTLMNYNSQIKVVKYNKDTIWLYDKKNKEKSMLIKVKGELNIEY
ncbi:hypothetical protein H3Z85_16470 [Chryseobacterium indologenes]|uniref:hypothetical protein n=1 Tax=Chryseobacterium indologenes TaxID=253 RepID=UPI0003E080E9|nr:hypothetical protein [Chryseobacterium indologenes]QPQ50950.1 hypothetical protein H3Z85_16470 [Chryseobacterium indologenes]GAE65907.1 hypothetical protein CIN01S_12_02790 [Chryseobacterium indologenes NBRC 14944]SFK08339.1 hypothetical protein SAMN05421692_3415 [Chryseobacterium indologenes]SUX49284.1 Uncharacterised protein [Chryseobacterium indologenes]